MKRDYKVYMITNLVNGKIYIGQTCRTIKDRWGNHIWTSQNTGSKSLLHKAIQKYGENDFNIEIIATCKTKEEINHKEIEMIQQYNSKSPNGYNLTDGGEGKHGIRWTEEQFKKRKKYKATDETNAKISEALKGRPRPPEVIEKIRISNTGKKLSVETIAKMKGRIKSPEAIEKHRIAMTGRKATAETRAKMSEAHKGLNTWSKGRKLSDDHKRKISEATKGKKKPPRHLQKTR